MIRAIGESFTMMFRMFEEPLCDLEMPWELPVPHWLLGAMLLYELMRGSVRNVKDFLWVLAQLIIVSRMELLTLALIVPILMGKYSTWCKSQEYTYGVAVFFLRISYIFINILMQLQNVSPQCIHRMEAMARRDHADQWSRYKY